MRRRGRMNPFEKFFQRHLRFGMLVDMDSPDEPGGMVDSGTGSDEMGGGADAGAGAGGSGTPDPAKGAGEGEGDGSGTPDPAKGDGGKPDYDQRFSALDSKFDSLLQALNKNAGSGNEGKDDKGGKDGLSGLERDDLVAMLAEDPAGFIGKITQVVESQVTDRVLQEAATAEMNKKVEQTITSYADQNPDFEKMWDGGQIKDYMSKNPGHNAISAHIMLTMSDKLAAAEKKGADEAIRNFRTKSNNQVLNGGTGISQSDRDAALKDPSKFGGRAAVLAARAGIK